MDRDILWKLLRHYEVPNKLVSLVKASYEGVSCKAIHGIHFTDSFQVKTWVKQGYLLSPFLFLVAIDWVMKTTTAHIRNGIQRTIWKQLDDLDFADDLALLSNKHQHMHENTSELDTILAGVGLRYVGRTSF